MRIEELCDFSESLLGLRQKGGQKLSELLFFAIPQFSQFLKLSSLEPTLLEPTLLEPTFAPELQHWVT